MVTEKVKTVLFSKIYCQI